MKKKLAAVLVLSLGLLLPMMAGIARAESYVPIVGAGSTWSQTAIDNWRVNVNQYGITVNYAGNGSSDGRNQFKNGTVDFAVSEIPYGLKDNGVVDGAPTRAYAYMPIVAGGTSFMYNLSIGGKRVTNLRLTGANLTKVFTGVITQWNDPLIVADNPSLQLPARRIVPVVRSDGSGTSAQFTAWMASQQPELWEAFCQKVGLARPCGQTSQYPTISGFVAQSGSLGVSGYVKQPQSEGAITYVEYSYALNANFPVVKVLNAAGYFVEPTAENVAVGLLQAKINTTESSPLYLTPDLSGVYNNADKRAYPLSSYSYMILPTKAEASFNNDKGKSLGAFSYYFLCEGQQKAKDLGYSPLPINLVEAGLDQVKRIPGVDVQSVDVKKCNNPTFSADGTNTLAKTAPQPPECAKQGPTQCASGGAKAVTAAAPTKTGTTTKASGGTATGRSGQPGTSSSPVTSGEQPVAVGAKAATPDADTGAVSSDSGASGTGEGQEEVAAVPVSVSQTLTSGQQTTVMIVAAAVLAALILIPPFISRRLRPKDPS